MHTLFILRSASFQDVKLLKNPFIALQFSDVSFIILKNIRMHAIGQFHAQLKHEKVYKKHWQCITDQLGSVDPVYQHSHTRAFTTFFVSMLREGFGDM